MKVIGVVRTACIAGLLLGACGAWAAELAKPTVLITGASRGIGFELARQYADKGWGVIATARNPAGSAQLMALAEANDNVVTETLDVTDFDEIDGVAERYRDVPIDVLINNAGILGDNEKQQFGSFDYSAFDAVMHVNTRGPIKMVEAFVDHVAASDQKKIMNISSAVGSIKLSFGGQTFYRASKAALNMSMRNISREMKRSKDPNRKLLIFGLIDPGIVKTDFAKNVPVPMIEPEESAAAVITVIDSYTVKDSGKFFTYTGKQMPW
jgi:NAD(P)-dependent dehydrogenase (short-subunit alcohol dehydrogenase family)